MPELPEVETTVRGLRTLVGARIRGVEVLDPRLTLPKAAIRGRTIERVERRGKYILIELSGGRSLVIHLRMSGRLTLVCEPEERHYARLILTLDRGTLYFVDPRRLGTAQLEQSGVDFPLGIDPLDPGFTADRLAGILRGSRAPIKSLLMNQKRIAGIGNIYASEILARAAIDPRRRGRELTAEETTCLRSAAVSVLQGAIDGMGTTLGSSISDYRQASGGAGSFQDRLSVYGREGEPCRLCGEPVARIVQAGRSTYYCPRCQR